MEREKAQVAFIHELGHHVSNKLNKTIFGYDRPTESITIYPSKYGDFFDGMTKSSNTTPNSYKAEYTPLEYLRAYYGCLFEGLFRSIDINECLCSKITPSIISSGLCKGRADYYQMSHLALRVEIKNKFLWWDFLTKNYFSLMKSKIKSFAEIFKLNFSDYILQEVNYKYYINLDVLDMDIENFLIIHKQDYIMAINELRKLNQ